MQCSKCGTENAASTKFCAECGTPMRREPAEAAAERRQLTVLFMDLVGSTALAESMDPEDLRELYARYQGVCADVIRRYEGYIAQHLGDGILAYFGYPTAHEDDALRAVQSGLEILQQVESVTMRGKRLHVRAGIHTGLVVVGEVGGGERREQLALGEAPNIAARVQSEAEPDTILITEATSRLMAGHVSLEDRGLRALKGISPPVHLFRVVGTSGAASRFEARAASALLEIARSPSATATTRFAAIAAAGLAPFVGREREVEAIRDAWAQAVSGTGRVVVLRGEAGIGKSRLLGAARRAARGRPHEIFEAQCSPYEVNSALHPVTEMLGRRLGVEDDTPSATILGRLQQFVALRGVRPDEAVPLLASLLTIPLDGHYPPSDLPPVRRRQRTLEILAELLLHGPDGSPVLMLIEDLHWADPSTLDLLEMLIARQHAAPLLLVCTTRPEGSVPGTTAPHYREITVTALPEGATRSLVAGVAGRRTLPDEILKQIVARTGGVPLFVEAVTRTVLEAGVLRKLEDRYELVGPLPPDLIPVTVHDSLMARIDRLGPDKPVAQLASTIGREFGFELLKTVSGLDQEGLQRALERLVELDLVSQSGEPPAATYTFKHALVQDAAYESLLRKTRQEYHGKIAAALLALFPDIAETRPDLVARHLEGAGRIPEAIDSWMKAGLQAQQRSAVQECVASLRKAIALLETFPADDPFRIEREMNAQLALGPALMATRGWGSREVETACNRARELCERTHNAQGLLGALWGLWTVRFVRGEHVPALEAAQSVLQMALATDTRILHVAARHGVGFTHWYRGEFPAAREHAEQALEIFDLEQEKALVRVFQIPSSVCCLAFLTMSLRFMGYPDQATRRHHELEALVEALANPACTSVGIGVGMYYYLDTHDVDAVAAKAEQAYALSVEEGFQFWSATMRVYRGWAQSMRGDTAAGLPEMRAGFDSFVRTEAGIYVPTMWLMTAEALRRDGQREAALEAIATGLRIVDEFHERYYESELHRVRGEILIDQGFTSDAEASLRRAFEIARGQQARLLELRSAVVLGRLLHTQGRGDEARRLIQPLYDWFTEGHESRDLVDARALLQSLDGTG